jgi:PAS domain S-box-containing protein
MDLSDRYREIVETSPDVIWVIDLEGRTVYANPALARVHRILDEDVPSLTVFDTLDEQGRGEFAAHLEDVLGGQPNEVEVDVQWVRNDGDIVWMRCRETPLFDSEGRLLALLHRYTDFTQQRMLVASLRASEDALADQVAQNQLMQAMASAANQAESLDDVLVQARALVLVHDDWARGRAFEPSTDGSGRLEPFYPVAGDREADLNDPLAPAELMLAQRAYDQRAAVWDERRLTIAFPVQHGDEVYAVVALTSALPLIRYEMIEAMAEAVAIQLARVAERERAQTELALARDQAMEASQQKSDFLATMSHEIRTPLNGVIGLNDLLLRTTLSPEQQRLATGAQVASRALLGLINDILDFSKIEAGRMELEQLDFEIRPLLEQAAGMLTEPARAKGLDLVISCHPDVPTVLSGDPTRIAQVVANLVSNAVKFTEHGGVTVRATAHYADDRVRLSVEVSDTGVGVPPTKLDHLFDPFTQGDSSTTRLYGGTGLGLAISREIVEAMGGALDYTPNLGGGSIFTFTALLDPGADDGSGDRSGSATDDQARDLLTGRRALVVDDNDTYRLILGEQVAWWGMAADTASSAAEAMTLLKGKKEYDVILLDLSVPEQDGLDLARWVRAEQALDGVRMLMMTSLPTLDLKAARDAGVDELLSKPVMSSALCRALLHLLTGEQVAAEVVALPDRSTGPSKGRILVVEDNAVNQLVASGLLTALGYSSRVAADGLAAIEAVHHGSFDAVLMDVQMPRMDGYMATRHIRDTETGPRLPIIAMTAAAVEGERERCLAAGMDDYLTKPVDPAALAETLERWLRPGPSYADRLDMDRLAELRELDDAGDETSYVDRAIQNFLTNAPTDIATLARAAANGNADELGALAHRLAGVALNLGAVAFGEAAREVELHTLNGGLADAVAALPRLEELLGADLEALRAYQREQFPLRAG